MRYLEEGAVGPAPAHDGGGGPPAQRASRLAADERFVRLRRRFAVQSVLLITVFLGWYMAYLVLSVYARELMAVQVAGAVNVGLLLGVGQFATTFLLAWLFVWYAEHRLDPLAEEIRADAEQARAAALAREGRVVRP